jgi:tetratricopeptide (TPR) repeat protein
MNTGSSEKTPSLIQSLEKRIEANPHSPSFARLASLYVNEGHIEKARVLCEEGIAHYPDYVTAHLVLGQCYLGLQRVGDARREFLEALTFQPQCGLALSLLRETLRTATTGLTAEPAAPEDWVEASSNHAPDEIVTPTLAEIYADQGAYQEAIRTYKLLLHRKPEKREHFEQRIRQLEDIWRLLTPLS